MGKPTRIPVSQAKLAANRANALRSTGPQTPEGKQKSSQNALKFGLLSDTLTVKYVEGSDNFAEHHDRLKASIQPEGPRQEEWVLHMALCHWRLKRLARFEAGIFDVAIKKAFHADEHNSANVVDYMTLADHPEASAYDLEQRRSYSMALGMEKCVHDTDLLPLFLRYQALTERQLRHAEEMLAKLQNEAKKRTQPTEKKPTFREKNEPTALPRRTNSAHT